MDLVVALEQNGYARDGVTLNFVIANTYQDLMYSTGAASNLQILQKYSSKYGNVIVSDIKKDVMKLPSE